MSDIATKTEQRTKTCWEYLQIEAGDQADLNPYGADGWELVRVLSHGTQAQYYFKRPLAAPES